MPVQNKGDIIVTDKYNDLEDAINKGNIVVADKYNDLEDAIFKSNKRDPRTDIENIQGTDYQGTTSSLF